MGLLSELNDEQRAAAAHPGGPMLILAGAGSGKTRVITYRIAHLIATGTPPERIVAVTFTNKAAGEMRERVLKLLERHGLDPGGRAPWLGTFHAFCLRLLRIEVERTPLRRGFVVYDQDDSRALVKACMRERGHDDKEFPPARVAGRISSLKSRYLGPDDVRPERGDEIAGIVADVYPLYQSRLLLANACDFDDLLVHVVRLLETDADVRDRWQDRILHLLVDEYQDTNKIQYRLVRLLSGGHQNVCAVGDEDQSIYRFRGAELGNILDFERDFPGTRVFRVERNYRSTRHILDAANAVVSRNESRKGKVLWTKEGDGQKVVVRQLATDQEEASWISHAVAQRIREVAPSEVAIAYRTNAQSRQFEEALGRLRVPHVVIGTLRFYERREVKDVLAYLRLAVNPHDDVALERVLNVPARGLGRGAQEAVRQAARQRNSSLWRAINEGMLTGEFPGRVEKGLDGFVTLVESLGALARERPAPDVIEAVLEATSYLAELDKEGAEAARDRRGNVAELVTAAAQHDQRDPEAGLVGFLADVALSSDTDELGGEGRVHLLTLHAAKGLEFDTVYLAGLEEELFPHASAESRADVEEERRLLYVGMTRARRRLVISHASWRSLYGRTKLQAPSRFLDELPEEHVEREGAPPRTLPQYVPGGGVSESVEALSGFFPDADIAYEEMSQDAPPAPVPAPAPAPARVAATKPAAWRVETPPDAAFDDLDLRRGDIVRHAKLGVGKVLAIEGRGPDAKLTVYFGGATGSKRLVQRYARLEKVGT